MIRGIGIDTVQISAIRQYLEDAQLSQAYIRHTFTNAERNAANSKPNQFEYFAARFAAKEAVFKAIGHLTDGKRFDFRLVETLNASDGCPFIHITPQLQQVMNDAKVDFLHISITTEGDYATAYVIAEERN